MTESAPMLRVANVNKTFEVYASQATTLKEMVLKGLFATDEKVEHVALRDVSFEVGRGESVAIIGGNGSGKSTLLKLISGISEPTGGEIELNGRVAALLELGAGFQPELTGMENIFLQGGILGMPRERVMERLPQILEFCELGPFIHTPMKRYSSGMVVRLGFALAVFSDADILLIDEVLAVGDVAFQEKCLQKIAQLRRHGKTILFVSHVIEHVELIAERILWLDQGDTVAWGPAEDVLEKYIERFQGQVHQDPKEVEEQDIQRSIRLSTALNTMRVTPRKARIDKFEILDESGEPRRAFSPGEKVLMRFHFTVMEPLEDMNIHIGYGGTGGQRVAYQRSDLQGLDLRNLEPGKYEATAEMENFPILPGRYSMSVGFTPPNQNFDYLDAHIRGYSIQIRGERTSEIGALVRAPGQWDSDGTEDS
ncbi:ABC transporter ATP-binding protein [bacterium]|nr:ABC transporter ATP-binding protein [bacterium]